MTDQAEQKTASERALEQFELDGDEGALADALGGLAIGDTKSDMFLPPVELPAAPEPEPVAPGAAVSEEDRLAAEQTAKAIMVSAYGMVDAAILFERDPDWLEWCEKENLRGKATWVDFAHFAKYEATLENVEPNSTYYIVPADDNSEHVMSIGMASNGTAIAVRRDLETGHHHLYSMVKARTAEDDESVDVWHRAGAYKFTHNGEPHFPEAIRAVFNHVALLYSFPENPDTRTVHIVNIAHPEGEPLVFDVDALVIGVFHNGFITVLVDAMGRIGFRTHGENPIIAPMEAIRVATYEQPSTGGTNPLTGKALEIALLGAKTLNIVNVFENELNPFSFAVTTDTGSVYLFQLPETPPKGSISVSDMMMGAEIQMGVDPEDEAQRNTLPAEFPTAEPANFLCYRGLGDHFTLAQASKHSMSWRSSYAQETLTLRPAQAITHGVYDWMEERPRRRPWLSARTIGSTMVGHNGCGKVVIHTLQRAAGQHGQRFMISTTNLEHGVIPEDDETDNRDIWEIPYPSLAISMRKIKCLLPNGDMILAEASKRSPVKKGVEMLEPGSLPSGAKPHTPAELKQLELGRQFVAAGEAERAEKEARGEHVPTGLEQLSAGLAAAAAMEADQ